MGDRLTNAWLRAKSYLRFFSNAEPRNTRPSGTESYNLLFEERFAGSSIDTLKWHIGQPWGPFHPESLQQYYGESTDFINVENGELELFTRYKPKRFYNFKDSAYITIPYGIGLVVSRQTFKYGYYEMEAMLPQGEYLWPALWLTALNSWPPEIDILESYSGKNGQYRDGLGIKDAGNEPNIHYGFVEDGTKSSYGGSSYPIPKEPTKRYVVYGLHWTEDFINVYYDGYLVFRCTQGNVLEYFNRPDVEMNIILNNALQSEVMGMKLQPSVFRVKSVRHFSKN
jgi:beta-glucanase (GH16 family)